MLVKVRGGGVNLRATTFFWTSVQSKEFAENPSRCHGHTRHQAASTELSQGLQILGPSSVCKRLKALNRKSSCASKDPKIFVFVSSEFRVDGSGVML